MPRETVYGVPFSSTAEEPAVEQVPVVEVMWGRQGTVQIVSRVTDPYGGRFGGETGEISYTDGMHVDLDRNGINTLIRNLRRARDQALGRDE